jgi:hypothetical protein
MDIGEYQMETNCVLSISLASHRTTYVGTIAIASFCGCNGIKPADYENLQTC